MTTSMFTAGAALQAVLGGVDGVLVGRLLLTVVLCGAVGLERSTHERASGFRPHILVGLGACLMTLAGGYGFADHLTTAGRDPMRVASYVVSGIGFLGAGAILRHGTTVRGLTTAASLWGAAGTGITVGVGLGGLAAVAVLLILFTLIVLERLEGHLRLGGRTSILDVHLVDDARAVGKALAAMERLDVPVRRATVLPGAGASAVLRVELSQALVTAQVPLLVQRLLSLKAVTRVDTGGVITDPDGVLDPGGGQEGEEDEAAILNLYDDSLLHDLVEGERGPLPGGRPSPAAAAPVLAGPRRAEPTREAGEPQGSEEARR